MRKFKKVIAGILAAASVMTCMALPASAKTISLTRGQAGSQANIIGAKQVLYTGECSSSSGSSAIFRLSYSSGGYLIDVDNFTCPRGASFSGKTGVYDEGKMWTYTVMAPNNNLDCVASGTIEALMY